jgi:hypothetical protein
MNEEGLVHWRMLRHKKEKECRNLEKPNIKHCKVLCRFKLDIPADKTDSAVDLNWTLDRYRLNKFCVCSREMNCLHEDGVFWWGIVKMVVTRHVEL